MQCHDIIIIIIIIKHVLIKLGDTVTRSPSDVRASGRRYDQHADGGDDIDVRCPDSGESSQQGKMALFHEGNGMPERIAGR